MQEDLQMQTAPIPVPSDFPVVWESPDDERVFWMQDAMHFPGVITALDDDVLPRTIYRGHRAASEMYDLPIRIHSRFINSYHYSGAIPVTTSPAELEALGARAQEKLGAAMARVRDIWDNECFPEIRDHLAYWKQFDLRAASMPELVVHLDETMTRFRALWRAHFILVMPITLAPSLFEEFYRDLFGTEDRFGAYRLLQGLENKTTEMGSALWQLSRRAQSIPQVHQVLQEQSAADVEAALSASTEGQAFLSELGAFLEEYGQRGNTWGLSYPTWAEDSTPVIKMLQDFIAMPIGGPDEELARLAGERELAVAQARDTLSGYPQEARDQFEFLLKAAQDSVTLQETHNFWIDFHAAAQVRKVFLEIGRRFVDAGVLEDRDDVFHLRIDEVRETAEQFSGLNRRTVVAERKSVMEHFRTIQPPPFLGTPPPGPPPSDPVSVAIGKFFGEPPEPSTEPGTIRGNSGSPGTVRGTARLISSLTEVERLQPGDVLVAQTTAPPWTPLFAIASAIVTDTGGILSHSAIVAREYGIPAVVGTTVATRMIHDGETIEVDGDNGVVRVIGENHRLSPAMAP